MIKIGWLLLLVPPFLSSYFSLGTMNSTKEDDLDNIVDRAVVGSMRALKRAVVEVDNRSLYPTYAPKICIGNSPLRIIGQVDSGLERCGMHLN